MCDRQCCFMKYRVDGIYSHNLWPAGVLDHTVGFSLPVLCYLCVCSMLNVVWMLGRFCDLPHTPWSSDCLADTAPFARFATILRSRVVQLIACQQKNNPLCLQCVHWHKLCNRAVQLIACDSHAHLISKAGSVIAVNLHHLFSNGAAVNKQS